MVKRRRVFAWSAVRTLMRNAGADIVSNTAVDLLEDLLERRARSIIEQASHFAKHSKRKKISLSDIEFAIVTGPHPPP